MGGGCCLASSPRPDRATESSDVPPASLGTAAIPCQLIPPPQREVDTTGVDEWCCTQAKVPYTRTINPNSICQEDSGLKLPIFPARFRSEHKECLKVNANLSDEDNEDKFPACLQPGFKEKSEFFRKFEFSSLDANGEETKITNSHESIRFFAGKDWGFEKLIGAEILLYKAIEPLPGGKPTIYCEVCILGNAKSISEYSDALRFKVPVCLLSDNIVNLSKSIPVTAAPSAMSDYETEKKILSRNKSEFRADFSFSIIIANRGGTDTVNSREVFRFAQGKDWGFESSIQTDILLNKVNGFLPDDKLTIYCEVHVLENSKDVCGTNSSVQLKIAQCRLSEDFGDLLGGHKFSDAIMSYNGLEYYVHKAILSTETPVLTAIIEHETEEESEVEITDMDHEALHEMLRYIYTGQSPNPDSMTIDLLAAADKYALGHLKMTSQEDLRSRRSPETVAELLILADAHNADQLNTLCH